DRAEQIAPLRHLVDGMLEQHPAEGRAHPLAARADAVDAEDLAKQLDAAAAELDRGDLGLAARARLQQRVAELSDRAAWVADEGARRHLLHRAAGLLQRLG